MKTQTTLTVFVLLCSVVSAHATIRTVSNDANRPAQFADVQSAINASVALDTVYVNGTQYVYADFTVNKKMVLIGAGYNSSNQFNLVTSVNNISFYRDAGTQDGSGTVITGFKINFGVGIAGGSLLISNLRFFRNQMNGMAFGAAGATNITIYNNIITSGIDGIFQGSNVIIQNNIFTTNVGISRFSQSSVVIDHNLFVHGNAFGGLQFATITNNIIIASDNTRVMDGNVVNCTFNANLSLSQNISPGSPTNSFLAQSNTGGGNIVGADPLFTACSDFNNFNYSFNYRLQSGSPGHNIGTDGTDIGIYGGQYPFPTGGTAGGGYDTSALPPIPQITGMNIQNASVLPGAQLKVSVQATINN
ncbi:MAG TPA: hypothetical protein VL728_12730 [Cyclobacteriaceae bacterium]|nr:hypothetical protein [Cyclobacteriaceae bacterium]